MSLRPASLKLVQTGRCFQTKALVGGQWITGNGTYPIFNPATGKKLADIVDASDKELVNQTIETAKQAFHHESWSQTSAKERSVLLKRWHGLILRDLDRLSTLLCEESGKPIKEARGEILYGASYIEWFAEEAKRTYGDVIPSPARQKRMMTIKQPIGVVAMITPWNFPNAMIARKVGPALAAGCTVVIKPASETPLSALALAELAMEAGFPKGVINVLPASRETTPMVGELLCTHPDIRKISFTGSTQVGKLLMRLASSTVKRLSLELGGNAPFIIFPDYGPRQSKKEFIQMAVQGLIAAKYRNAGQTCVCPNRIFVHESIHDEFVETLAEKLKQELVLGDGQQEGVNVGPLISEAACVKVESLVEDALDKRASVVTGGRRATIPNGSNLFYEPTLIADCHPTMRVAKEEIFGPVLPIFKFSSEQEVIDLANAVSVGLAGYFYSNDLNRVWKVAEALEFGMIGVNEGMISSEVIPFGGVKESGFGREGSHEGMDEYLNIKYICMGNLK